jgi:hypothetical protein
MTVEIKLIRCTVGYSLLHHRRNEDNLEELKVDPPVPMAARSKTRSNTGIVGSNPARDMDVSPRSSVLCCPV